MKYTKSQLRNPNFALLRRVQRQMEKRKEGIVENYSKLIKRKKEISVMDKDTPVKLKKEKYNKKLNLLDRRNMFAW